ncbi:hypothetical protein E2C01_100791 [Portunus trituberculatus]|uniref:Uncharacterized protein n=1 Tax=Portunus trituberculatus TaxID=210409 RepID=A0A5B7KIF7_PORTR|nr:hypothetical protein [Portunus trituberculatus]
MCHKCQLSTRRHNATVLPSLAITLHHHRHYNTAPPHSRPSRQHEALCIGVFRKRRKQLSGKKEPDLLIFTRPRGQRSYVVIS